MTTQAIIYTRVSSKAQAASGLGLENQLSVCLDFIAREGMDVIGTFTAEATSGSYAQDKNKALAGAVALSKKTGACIIVAKLCRLSRKVSVIANLMEEGVPFISVELGKQVDPLILHVWSAVNENYRLQISKNTKAALAAWKARPENQGKRLGASDDALKKARAASQQARTESADAYANQVKIWMEVCKQSLLGKGITPSWRKLADEMNASGFRTKRGSEFHGATLTPIAKRTGWKIK